MLVRFVLNSQLYDYSIYFLSACVFFSSLYSHLSLYLFIFSFTYRINCCYFRRNSINIFQVDLSALGVGLIDVSGKTNTYQYDTSTSASKYCVFFLFSILIWFCIHSLNKRKSKKKLKNKINVRSVAWPD